MPLTFYKCAKCKLVHDTYEEAVKCELSHLVAVAVRPLEYRHGAYPFRVTLVFPDGKEQPYTKDD